MSPNLFVIVPWSPLSGEGAAGKKGEVRANAPDSSVLTPTYRRAVSPPPLVAAPLKLEEYREVAGRLVVSPPPLVAAPLKREETRYDLGEPVP